MKLFSRRPTVPLPVPLLLLCLLVCAGTARKLQITMVCGIVLELKVTSKTKISHIKEKIHKLQQIHPGEQILMSGAIVLRNDLRLRDYGTPERLDLLLLSDPILPLKTNAKEPSPVTGHVTTITT